MKLYVEIEGEGVIGEEISFDDPYVKLFYSQLGLSYSAAKKAFSNGFFLKRTNRVSFIDHDSVVVKRQASLFDREWSNRD